MNTAYLLTGGNMGDTKSTLMLADKWIERYCGQISKASSLYETAAWGKEDQPPFLNQALEIKTILSAPRLLDNILTIEKKMGRVRKEKNGPRIIDIDILFFNSTIFQSKELTIPHPEMQNRRFALVPLADIANDFVHPVLKKTIGQLLNECPDTLPVKKVIE
jgi:2-amino-4-hydroxy-6-hydroxymethyldihydropteridine diphosphokinase